MYIHVEVRQHECDFRIRVSNPTNPDYCHSLALLSVRIGLFRLCLMVGRLPMCSRSMSLPYMYSKSSTVRLVELLFAISQDRNNMLRLSGLNWKILTTCIDHGYNFMHRKSVATCQLRFHKYATISLASKKLSCAYEIFRP